MKPCLLRTTLAVVGVIGFALPASMAMAQGSQGQGNQGQTSQNPANPRQDDQGAKGANRDAAAQPGNLAGVVVQAPNARQRVDKVPPDRAATFDEEAAKNEAWKRYRDSTPPVSAGTLGQSEDYPGLQTLIPH